MANDGLLDVVEDIKKFMKQNRISRINLGGISFIYGEED